MAAVLALDQGTTSSRALVFNQQSDIIAQAHQEFTQAYPHPGWVEHDPEEIWNSQRAVAALALAEAGHICAIGITNQRETTVLWDRHTHRALAPAIVWQDRRTAKVCEQLTQDGRAELIAQRTGLVVDAYFSATKLAWLLDHVPHARARAIQGELAFGTIESWLLYRLTNGAVHATDVSNAARTMLFNVHTLAWDERLLELFAIPAQLLPAVVPCGVTTALGHTDVEGLPRGIPIHAMVGDQQAALFGQICTRPGMVKNTYGTGCFMLMNTGAQPRTSTHRLLATVGWQWAGETTYALEGSVFVAGAAIQWLRDGLGVIQHAAEIGPLAESVPDTAGVAFVPALSGLGAPHWRPHARGTISGITRGTTRAHLARATLEAIAFQSTELVDAMAQDAQVSLNELRVDGGASRCDLLMQMQADFAQVPVVRAGVSETTALGAAYLAGLGSGLWSGLDEIAALWRADRVFQPEISATEAAQRLARWREIVAQTPVATV